MHFACSNHTSNPLPSSFMTYHRVCGMSNPTNATSGAGIAHPTGVHEFISGFSGVPVAQYLFFCIFFVDHCLSFCPIYFDHCCLSFFDIRFRIIPLVS